MPAGGAAIVLVTQWCQLFGTPGVLSNRLLCAWNSPGKNTRVGSHSLLQGNLPDPGYKPRSPALQADHLSHQGSPLGRQSESN